jgi:hypothetical protein
MIWLFETVHTKLNGESPLFSNLGPSGAMTIPLDGTMDGASERTTSPRRQKPFLSNRVKTLSQHFPEIANADGAQSPGPQNFVVKSKKEGKSETVVVDNPALEQKVEDLSAKIAELTALIMAQQGIGGEEP